MSVQLKRRRDSAAFLATFVGGDGELIVDTTNRRVQVHDGSTPGGFATARLADLPSSSAPLALDKGGTGETNQKNARAALGLDAFTGIGDANYAVLPTDRTIVLTVALTAPRTLQLPAASAFNPGARLRVVDQAGGISATNTLTIAAAGGDALNGASAAVFRAPFTDFDVVTDGASKWTYDVQGLARGGTGATGAAGARNNLGAAASGPNADITALSGLTTPLSLQQGGTGGTDAAGARASLGLGSIATQAASAVAITGGSAEALTLGSVTRAPASVTNLSTSGLVSFVGSGTVPGFCEYRTSGGTRYGYSGFKDASTNLLMAAEQGWGWRLQGANVFVDPPAILGSTLSVSGQMKGTAIGGGPAATILASASNNVAHGWQVTGQPADGRVWDAIAVGTALSFRAVNDANSNATTWLNVVRSGFAVTSVAFGAPVTLGDPLGLKSYTVATLPAPGTPGRTVYCSNARTFSGLGTMESGGAGSGSIVFDAGSQWRIAGTNVQAQA